ncbi:MAG TPA: hypothetical protein VER76_21865 [Pyrinomonadaceae bacterium]|nr:hypothetical protein [Pyrinomonadaceae bacterium]
MRSRVESRRVWRRGRQWLLASFGGVMLCVALLVAVTHARQQGENFQGYWSMELLPEGDTLSVMLGRTTGSGGKDNRYFKLRLNELTGIERGQIETGSERARFQLKRRAGVFDFSGAFARGKGTGTFSFTVEPEFIAAMEREGYAEGLRQNLFGYAIGDFGGKFAGEFAELGLERPTVKQFQRMQTHGVTIEFVKELKALGYEPRSIDQLISLRIHGATVEYIKSLTALGYELPSLDELVQMRIHGVSVKFIKDLEALGYESPPLKVLTSMRIHGASPEFIAQLRALGYERLPLERLVALRIHGVTPDFIQRLSAAGHANVPVERLIDLRMFQMPEELLNHLPSASEKERSSGDWLMKVYARGGGSKAWLLLRGKERPESDYSVEISSSQVQGLTEAQAFSGGAPVRFTVTLKGGVLDCTGWFKDGYGTGVFNGNPAAGKH